jgi:hypothetical protein
MKELIMGGPVLKWYDKSACGLWINCLFLQTTFKYWPKTNTSVETSTVFT